MSDIKIDLDEWHEDAQNNAPEQNTEDILLNSAESIGVILNDPIISKLSKEEIFKQLPMHIGIHAVLRTIDSHNVHNRNLKIEELRLQQSIAVALDGVNRKLKVIIGQNDDAINTGDVAFLREQLEKSSGDISHSLCVLSKDVFTLHHKIEDLTNEIKEAKK